MKLVFGLSWMAFFFGPPLVFEGCRDLIGAARAVRLRLVLCAGAVILLSASLGALGLRFKLTVLSVVWSAFVFNCYVFMIFSLSWKDSKAARFAFLSISIITLIPSYIIILIAFVPLVLIMDGNDPPKSVEVMEDGSFCELYESGIAGVSESIDVFLYADTSIPSPHRWELASAHGVPEDEHWPTCEGLFRPSRS